MKLIPLQQWVCDTCGGVINSPEEGYIQWKRRGGNLCIEDIKIVHHKLHSPLVSKGNDKGCYVYDADSDLKSFTGVMGIIEMLSLLDPGKNFLPVLDTQAEVRIWVETMRRLQIPHYEEARRYMAVAKSNGDLGGVNEVAIYTPDFLQKLIKKYRARADI